MPNVLRQVMSIHQSPGSTWKAFTYAVIKAAWYDLTGSNCTFFFFFLCFRTRKSTVCLYSVSVWNLAPNCREGSSCEATSVAGELLVALCKHMSLPHGFQRMWNTWDPGKWKHNETTGLSQLMLIILFRMRLFARTTPSVRDTDHTET